MKYLGYFAFCYALGWIMTGYIVVRLLAHTDIRSQGSGNIGALNSGRTAGVKGFILTFLGDSLKGGVAVASGIGLEFPEWILLLGLTSVVAGHIWPLPFRFRGGKGIATLLGGLLIYSPSSLLFLLIVTGVFYLLVKEFTLSGLIAVLLWPVFQFFQGSNLGTCLMLSGMILWAHRKNIQGTYGKYLKSR